MSLYQIILLNIYLSQKEDIIGQKLIGESRRSEARNVPSLLVAPERALEVQNAVEDEDGWYSDGAYTGMPDYQQLDEDDLLEHNQELDEDEKDAQEAYYAALRQRFSRFRGFLQNSPSSLKPSPATPSPALEPFSKQPQWSYHFRFSAPTAQQVTKLAQERVMLALTRIESILTKKNLTASDDQGKNLGAWVWALLAKCRPLGQMRSEDVAVIRKLGITAIKVTEKIIRDAEKANITNVDDGEDRRSTNSFDTQGPLHGLSREATQDQSVVKNEPCETVDTALTVPSENARTDAMDTEHNRPDADTCQVSTKEEMSELELAKQRLLLNMPTIVSEALSSSSLDAHNPPDGNDSSEEHEFTEIRRRALATLDIIVTIIGEEFGQRDLLDRREVWGEDE
jgi:hypothetical protein